MAWLNATPEGSEKSRRETYEKVDPDSNFLKMPEVEVGVYLINFLIEAGTMSCNGMGVTPLSWIDIDAWLRSTELELMVWEKLMIRELSIAYVSELHDAKKRECPAPYTYVEEEEQQIDREAVANKLLTALRSMKRTPTT